MANVSKDQVTGIIRHVLTAVGGIFVTLGKFDPTDGETLVGAGMALVGVIWSLVAKKKAA